MDNPDDTEGNRIHMEETVEGKVMIKTEHYHTDEIEVSVESKEWVEVKALDFTKDPFQYNIIQMKVLADLYVSIEETKGFLGVFIDDEPNPRAVIESDLTFPHVFKVEFDTINVPYGRHTLKIKMKSEQGYRVTNSFLEVHITRWYNLYEMMAQMIPLAIMGVLD